MHYSHLATIAAFAAPLTSLSKAQSTAAGIPEALKDRWEQAVDQGKDQWTISFPNNSPKTYEEVNATSDMSYTNRQLFHQQYLDLHNDYRAEHNASKLEWNVTLAAAAANHAEKCMFEHTENNPYGENLVAGYANMSASMAAWADERDSYNFDDGKFDKKTGHFTQMVWASTTQVGCGRCYCGGGTKETGGDDSDKAPGWMVVCEYAPPGNFEGQFRENVRRKSDETASDETGSDEKESDETGSDEKGAAGGLVSKSGLVVATAIGVAALLI